MIDIVPMRALIYRLLVFPLIILCGAINAAHATPILVDQQNLVFDASVGSILGQTFQPTLDRIDFAEFSINVPGANLLLEVTEADRSTVIGTSGVVSLNTTGFETVRFDLLTPVTLVPGNTYLLRPRLADLLGASNFNVEVSYTNPYPGGILVGLDEDAPNIDMVFTEGIYIAGVPEPSTFVLAFVGLLSLGIIATWRLIGN